MGVAARSNSWPASLAETADCTVLAAAALSKVAHVAALVLSTVLSVSINRFWNTSLQRVGDVVQVELQQQKT